MYTKYQAYICLYVNSLPSAHPQTGRGLDIDITNTASQDICLEDDYIKVPVEAIVKRMTSIWQFEEMSMPIEFIEILLAYFLIIIFINISRTIYLSKCIQI